MDVIVVAIELEAGDFLVELVEQRHPDDRRRLRIDREIDAGRGDGRAECIRAPAMRDQLRSHFGWVR
jgi:hypothetical protein